MSEFTMLEAALEYASRGWPVFPVHTPIDADRCSCEKPDCGDQNGKHPRTGPGLWHGLHDATVDTAVVRSWWQRWPDANIGLRTGVAFDVFDIDTPDMLTATEHLDMFEIVAPTVRTGSLGWHLYVTPTGHGNRQKIDGHPLDWRGQGGYVIAPPSLHRCGRRYEWVTVPGVAVHPCPQVLLDMLEGRRKVVADLPQPFKVGRTAHLESTDRGAALTGGRRRNVFSLDCASWNPDGLVDRVRNATNGERNAILHWAAWRVGIEERNGKCTNAQAVDALELLAGAATQAGLSGVEVYGRDGHGGTVRSGYRNGFAGKGAA